MRKKTSIKLGVLLLFVQVNFLSGQENTGEIDQFKFATPELQQRTQYFHDLAKSVAGKEWFVQRFQKAEKSAQPTYLGMWQTEKYHKNYYQKSTLPFRSISILLEGNSGEREVLNSLSVQGRWVPEHGWAALVDYNPDSGCRATVGLVRQQEASFSFDTQDAAPLILLTGNHVFGSTSQKPSFRVKYQAQLPNESKIELISRRRERFWKLFESPESMRDVVIADLDQLRRIAKDQISRSENMTVWDMKNVRSDNPPREVPDFKQNISESTKEELLKQILRKLDAQEILVRENFKLIHAALQKALPLDKSKLP